MNPIIPVGQYEKIKANYPDIPSYPAGPGQIKVPAAWLIDRCGWKGKAEGGAAVYEKQCLVLINQDHAKAQDVLSLAEKITISVKNRFGITIHPEVNFID